jgi:hypothetical protein
MANNAQRATNRRRVNARTKRQVSCRPIRQVGRVVIVRTAGPPIHRVRVCFDEHAYPLVHTLPVDVVDDRAVDCTTWQIVRHAVGRVRNPQTSHVRVAIGRGAEYTRRDVTHVLDPFGGVTSRREPPTVAPLLLVELAW